MDLVLIPQQYLRLPNAGLGPARTARCEARGYCGPFANEALYDAFPEAMWHGMGDCLERGTTCHIQREVERHDAALVRSVA